MRYQVYDLGQLKRDVYKRQDFNRPRVVRWIEYIRFWITKKPHSLGIMQVQTNKYINDETSIRLAVRKICKDGNNFIEKHEDVYKRQLANIKRVTQEIKS